MDFISDILNSGRKFRVLNILDDFNREAVAQEIAMSIPAERVIRILERVIWCNGKPDVIRCDNEPEFISHKFQACTLETRTLLRSRDAIVRDLSWMKQRIKSLLYFYGISYPVEFTNNGTHWSRRFMRWLREDVSLSTSVGMDGLTLLLDSADNQRKLLLDATRKLRQLSRMEQYALDYGLLRSVPGVGMITALSLLAEIEDIKRFSSSDMLAGYIGLVPTSHDSGDKIKTGEMTFRGQMQLRSKLIECSWLAARIDPALHMAFLKLTGRMEPNKAIVRIARKVLNRIFYVLKYRKEYECSVVK